MNLNRNIVPMAGGAFMALVLLFVMFPRLALAAEEGQPKEEKSCAEYLVAENTYAYELSLACTINKKYGHIIDPIADLHEYDKNLITAVIIVESRGNVNATSHVGARGLMQLMPKTAKYMGAQDIRDPLENILAGTRYLRLLENQYGFLSVEEALLAYNMGPRKASEWLEESGRSASDAVYVKKVMNIYHELSLEEERQKMEAQKKSTEDFLKKILLRITAGKQHQEIPKLLSARRLEIEAREE